MYSVRASTGEHLMKSDSTKSWLKIDNKHGFIERVSCKWCQDFEDELWEQINFSSSFITGLIGGAIKKDTSMKILINIRRQQGYLPEG